MVKWRFLPWCKVRVGGRIRTECPFTYRKQIIEELAHSARN